MRKKELVEKAEKYSKDSRDQRIYIAGFQEACNIILNKINTLHMGEFVDEMEELSTVAYMEFDELY